MSAHAGNKQILLKAPDSLPANPELGLAVYDVQRAGLSVFSIR
jgi:hypothetical protein